MTATLTGKYIANTYKPLLQLKGDRPASPEVGIDNATVLNQRVLVDGEGKRVGSIVLEHDNSGGFFTKNINHPNLAWRIQHRTINNQEGLNFSYVTNNGDVANGLLFVKNIGSVWVGFNVGNTNEIGPNISNATFYLKGGMAFKDINNNDTISTSNAIRIFNSDGKLNTRIGTNNLPLFTVRTVVSGSVNFPNNHSINLSLQFPSSIVDNYNMYVVGHDANPFINFSRLFINNNSKTLFYTIDSTFSGSGSGVNITFYLLCIAKVLSTDTF
jgi:hypothetical protein